MSLDGLARRMTQAGVPISASAIYKIESADPPRRITVDELVGLSRALNLTMDELLTPLEVIGDRQAQELLAQLDTALYALEARPSTPTRRPWHFAATPSGRREGAASIELPCGRSSR